MRYCVLIHYDEDDPAVIAPLGTPERRGTLEEYRAFGAEADAAGVVLDGDALHPTTTATSVRVRDDRIVTIDGPFAETKEQLGGFYVFECDDMDQAVEWAARIPHAAKGTIEVRPIIGFGERPDPSGPQKASDPRV